jgi:hypothetical protein
VKGAFIGSLMAIALLMLAFIWLSGYKTESSFDVHIRDTWYILDYSIAIVFSILLIGTFFSIGGVIATHFKNKLFVILLVIFLSLDFFIIASFYISFTSSEKEEVGQWNLNKSVWVEKSERISMPEKLFSNLA